MSHSVQLVSEVHNLKHSVWRYAVNVWKSRYESGARNKAVGSHPSPIPGAIDASVSAQRGGFCLLQACIHDLDLFFSANIAGRGIVIKLNSIMLLPLLKSLGNSSHTSGFPGGSLSKVSAFSVGDPRLIPGLGRSLGEGSGSRTPVVLPGESHGWRSLMGYRPWGRKESDTTERLHFLFFSCFTVESHVGFSLGGFWSIPRDTDSGLIPSPRTRTLASIPDVLREALC